MKKHILTAITFLLIGVGSASAQAVWGARLGLARPTFSSGEDGSQLTGKFGVEVGPTMYYGIKNNFYFNAGAMFKFQGFEESESGYTAKFNAIYLDIPLNLGISFPVGGLSLYAQAGPFLGLKLSEKYEVTHDGDTETLDEDLLNGMNAGLGLMAGINLNKFKVELGYQIGLANVAKETEADVKIGSLFVGVSYVF